MMIPSIFGGVLDLIFRNLELVEVDDLIRYMEIEFIYCLIEWITLFLILGLWFDCFGFVLTGSSLTSSGLGLTGSVFTHDDV